MYTSYTQPERMYDYDKIPLGYYDKIYRRQKGVRSFWHWLKFETVVNKLKKGHTVLDVGCFSGTFLGILDPSEFPRQHGVDILHDQIHYANKVYGNQNRKFTCISSLKDLENCTEFVADQITLIEVIEHLNNNEINTLFEQLVKLLPKGGRVVLTTPNYSSFWFVQEVMVDYFSGLNYTEQHLTKFSFFNFKRKIKQLYPAFDSVFKCNSVQTSHFLLPVISLFSFNLAARLSKRFHPVPLSLGSLLLVELEKISE